MLTRRYAVEPNGNSRTSLVTPDIQNEIHRMADAGKGPTEIGRIVGLGRKQVERLLAKSRKRETNLGGDEQSRS